MQDSAPVCGLALLFFQIEQFGGPYRLMCQTPAGRDDCGDAAACRFHPSHSDPQEVLAAVPRFACEVCRFDPAAFQVLLESCRHVQYMDLMPMQYRCQCVRADGGTGNRSILAIKAQNPAFVTSFLTIITQCSFFRVKLFLVHQGWKSPVSSPLMRVCVGSGGFATTRAGDLRDVQTLRGLGR